jgi:hypothetical protein
MRLYVYRATLTALFIVGVYDWFTSFLGAAALFKLTKSSPFYLWGFPVAISIGATALNMITIDIWEYRNRLLFLKFVWVAFLIYDYYTSYLGIAEIVIGGNLFKLTFHSLFSVFRELTIELNIMVFVLAFIVVASPMSAFIIVHKMETLKPEGQGTTKVLP